MKKQIIIHTDDSTHAWIKAEADTNRRTLGNQILSMLIGVRGLAAKPTRTTKPKRSKSVA